MYTEKKGKGESMRDRLTFLKITFVLCSLLSGSVLGAAHAQAHQGSSEWSWFFSKKFSEHELQDFNKKDHISFVLHTPQFSQLILSWNALRPQKGHFRFWVQAQDSKTKKWYDPHHIIDWGKEIQRSYISVDEKGTGCYHVRLELPKQRRADAFRVKIEVHDGAELNLLHSLHVCVSDLAKFKSESASQYTHLKSVAIHNVPKQSQMVLNHPRANNLCSPTSLSMLLGFLKQTPIDPVSCAEHVYDSGLDSFGSWPFNVAHAFELCQGTINFGVTRLSSFSDLHKQLMNNIPVMVSVRGDLKGAAKPYSDGHLLLVTGFDAKHKRVLCHDPAFEDTEKIATSYDLESFLHAWGRSRNLSYVVEPIV